jgi:uncharacterized membrane protein
VTATEMSGREIDRQSHSGTDTGRLLGLTDGVFAFAITLLVVELFVPVQCEAGNEEACLVGTLLGDKYVFLSYAFSFFIIGVWWVQHKALFRYIHRYDPVLVWTNLVFLLTIAITPFLLGLTVDFLAVEFAVVVFALVAAAAGFLLALIWEVAVHDRLVDSRTTRAVVSRMRSRGLFPPCVFLVSAAIATVSVVAAHVVWIGVFAVILWTQFASVLVSDRRVGETPSPEVPQPPNCSISAAPPTQTKCPACARGYPSGLFQYCPGCGFRLT